VDNTRDRNHPYTCKNIKAALEDTVRTYRKSLWDDNKVYIEIWLEKDALAGVIEDITRKYDVSLMVARGYSSITFLKDAAEHIKDQGKPTYIYHLGDYDPSGVNAGENIEEFLREYTGGDDFDLGGIFLDEDDFHFTRLAVTEEQIEEWDLPTRPTKQSDSRAARFGDERSVELDAIEPRRLRSLVEAAILTHMSKRKYQQLMAQEKREKQQLSDLIDDLEIME
jgi:hypothetical protein